MYFVGLYLATLLMGEVHAGSCSAPIPRDRPIPTLPLHHSWMSDWVLWLVLGILFFVIFLLVRRLKQRKNKNE